MYAAVVPSFGSIFQQERLPWFEPAIASRPPRLRGSNFSQRFVCVPIPFYEALPLFLESE
jgi:hypothetical protein